MSNDTKFLRANSTWSAVTINGGLDPEISLHRPGKPDVKLGELADRYCADCEVQAKEAELKKREKEEKVLGAVAIALSGAGAVANKNPVVSRRFWSWGRK